MDKETYKEATEALKVSFGNNKVIITSYMNSLIYIPSVVLNFEAEKIR